MTNRQKKKLHLNKANFKKMGRLQDLSNYK